MIKAPVAIGCPSNSARNDNESDSAVTWPRSRKKSATSGNSLQPSNAVSAQSFISFFCVTLTFTTFGSLKSQVRADRSIHHVRKVDRLITALVEECKHAWISEWTNFMKDIRSPRSKKVFEHVHVCCGHRLRYAKPKSLSQRRSGSVEHRVGAGHFYPRCAYLRKRPGASFDKLSIAARLGEFETSSQIDVCKWIFQS